MPGSTDLSVVIPCFNAGATLAETIQSALLLVWVEAEVVVVDDGSIDDSLEVARSFEPRVRVLTGPNRGVSAARNRGIAETKGEWIVFLDADDLLLPGTLAKRLQTGAASGADVVICDWQELIDSGTSSSETQVRSLDMRALGADPELACAMQFWATTAALMYRRGLVERIGGFRHDLPVIQDARFMFDAAYHGARFAHSPHVGAHYRVLPNSLSRRDPTRFWRDVLSNGKQIEELWQSRGPLSLARRETLRGIFDNAARGLFAAGDPAYFDALRRQRELGLGLTLHPRIAGPLARAVGLGPARELFRLVGR
jgi:glycosyltransferase involved in cell wall biosynthesis